MKIWTSYYANAKNLPSSITPIAISLSVPKSESFKIYKKLCPTWFMLNEYKEDNDKNKYTERFNILLKRVNCDKVVKELQELSEGKDVCLLCYEKPDDFCHRHLVAKHLKNNGYECKEWRG